MPLLPSQVEHFRREGYVAVPAFFSAAEVKAMQNEVQRFKREGLLNNVATDGDGVTKSTSQRNLQICPMYHKSSLFRALPFDAKVVEAVGQLIGEPYLLHLDQLFLKPGGDGMGTNWHQDNAYFRISDPLKGTAMWIAVHDATVANGTLHVIPNCFREALPHQRDPMSNHHIRCWPDETREVAVELPAGGVVFFCYGTPHSTKGNRTASERAGAAFHFLHEAVAATSSYGPALVAENRTYNPYLSGPKASGGFREYGTTVAGTWPIEVAKAMSYQAVGA